MCGGSLAWPLGRLNHHALASSDVWHRRMPGSVTLDGRRRRRPLGVTRHGASWVADSGRVVRDGRLWRVLGGPWTTARDVEDVGVWTCGRPWALHGLPPYLPRAPLCRPSCCAPLRVARWDGGRDGEWWVGRGARRWTPLGCQRVARAVPPVSARDVRRGDRPGARHRAADGRAGQGPDQPRLPVLRSARLRQDDQRPDPGPLPELRAGPHRHPVRRVRLLPRPGARRAGQPGRRRDRRRQPRRGGRRPQPAGTRGVRSRSRPLQGLHHRRGPHGLRRRASTPC